jgi:AbiTii
MSVSEARISLSLDDILTALESRLESEEAIDKLPLTQALEQCLLYAEAHHFIDLAKFVKQELYGYSSQPPSHRYIKLGYFDTGGQFVNGLNQYSDYPVVTGVCKLELHRKNGLTLMLPKQILTFLSQVSGREVDTGHISPAVINNILEVIRKEIIHRIIANAT